MSDELVMCPYCAMPLIEHETSAFFGVEWAKCRKAPEGTFTESDHDGPVRVWLA